MFFFVVVVFAVVVSFFFNVACSLDFEDGIGGWEMTGRAFIYQPTFGDNPAARRRESANLQGDWWIGGAEKRSSESDSAGGQHTDGADVPHGTLTSPCFRIVGKNISFLIGGGCTVNEVYAELIVNNQVRLFPWTIIYLLILLKQLTRLIKVSQIWLSKLRNHFELCDIHKVRLGLK